MVATVGSISIDLSANTAKFIDGFKRTATTVEQQSAKMARSIKGVDTALAGISGFAKGALGAFAGFGGLGLSIQAFIENTIEAEKVTKQLEAAIKSTGGAAGLSVEDLQKMASGLQSVTTYGDEAIQQMQAVLLTFTKIGRQTFPVATEAVLDMATRLGTDLTSSAIQLGKALNDPIAGITSLQRVGVAFSDAQKKMIADMVRQNNLAGAQAIILKELQVEFGGSARAARDTLGGALQALGEAWGDLFEITGKSSEEVRKSVEKLITTISDPKFQEAVNNLGAGLFKAGESAARGAMSITEEIARIQKAVDEYKANPNVDTLLNIIGDKLVEGGPADRVRDFFVAFQENSKETSQKAQADIDAIQRKIDDLQNQIVAIITNPNANELDLFDAQKMSTEVDGLKGKLGELQAAGVTAANKIRAAMAEAFRAAENASMDALADYREANPPSAAKAPGVTRFNQPTNKKGQSVNGMTYQENVNGTGVGVTSFGDDLSDTSKNTRATSDNIGRLDTHTKRYFDGLSSDLGGYFDGLGSSINDGTTVINTSFKDLQDTLFELFKQGVTNPKINYGSGGAFGPNWDDQFGSYTDVFNYGSLPKIGPMNEGNSIDQISIARPGTSITLNYNAALGESDRTARQRAREMWDELNLQAARA